MESGGDHAGIHLESRSSGPEWITTVHRVVKGENLQKKKILENSFFFVLFFFLKKEKRSTYVPCQTPASLVWLKWSIFHQACMLQFEGNLDLQKPQSQQRVLGHRDGVLRRPHQGQIPVVL